MQTYITLRADGKEGLVARLGEGVELRLAVEDVGGGYLRLAVTHPLQVWVSREKAEAAGQVEAKSHPPAEDERQLDDQRGVRDQ